MAVKKAQKEVLLKTLHDTQNITLATKTAGVARSTFYDLLKSDAEFKAQVDAIDESRIDEVEDCLMKQIREGNTTATIFFLKTKAKHRGYTEKMEVDHNTSDSNTPIINFISAPKDSDSKEEEK